MIIDISLFTAKFGSLTFWEFSEEYFALSGHKLILLRWKDIDVSLSRLNIDRATKWDVQGFIGNKDQLCKAREI